jgi:hypothetical protein
VRLSAAASSSLRSALAGTARPGTWLGATPAGLYLRIIGAPGVLALLVHDAVRLPCALVLPTTRAELSVESLGPAVGTPTVGDGALAWIGPAGLVVVRAVREWAPARVRGGAVVATTLAAMRAGLPAPAALGIDDEVVPMLTSDPAAAVARLLGRGPGLTPAGDDVLAGFLVGARAFGLVGTEVGAAIAALAPARTTALSAALLWHAARGECIDELAAVGCAVTRDVTGGDVSGGDVSGGDLTGGDLSSRDVSGCGQLEPALGRLLAVGHTSGAALATGLAAAAAAALAAGTTGAAGLPAGTASAGAAA